MAWFRSDGGSITNAEISRTIHTSTVMEEIYTFTEDIDILIVEGLTNYAYLGYVNSGFFKEIVVGQEYFWGISIKQLVVKGVKAGFQMRLEYDKQDYSIYTIKA